MNKKIPNASVYYYSYHCQETQRPFWFSVSQPEPHPSQTQEKLTPHCWHLRPKTPHAEVLSLQ